MFALSAVINPLRKSRIEMARNKAATYTEPCGIWSLSSTSTRPISYHILTIMEKDNAWSTRRRVRTEEELAVFHGSAAAPQ